MNFFPKNGEKRGSERWDSASSAWVPADEWQARQWAREDAAFARRANQGDLQCPSVIFDSQRPLQSQVTGKIHDSKSSLRREYREHGMLEVGNEKITPKRREDPTQRRDVERALMRAKSELDIPTNITKVVHDEAGMNRLRALGKVT